LKTLKKLIEEYNNGAVYTAFDTETTGLSRHTERVIEIGAVKFSKDNVIAEYNALIYPEKNMSPQVIRIHGISDEMLAGKPLFKEIADEFLDFITGTTLVAHNAQFDIGFINKELELAGMNGLKNARTTIDTLYLSRRFFPETEKHSLQFLADFLKIPSGTAHRATDDARVCMELFRKCISRAELKRGQ